MSRSVSRLLIFCLGTLFFVSCKKEIDPIETTLQQVDYKNVSYGTDPAQKMDVYLPAGRTTASTKSVLFVHGGSWSGGDKVDFDGDIASFRTLLPDYAIFNMNYRLAASGANQYPTQMTDIQMAVQFMQTKSAEYKVDATKIGMVGASAGGHLSLLYAYKSNTSGYIKAVVDLFGPTDLADLYNNHPIPAFSQPVLLNFLGTTPALNTTLYQGASPINYVTAQSPPTIIFHGTADFVVPISQSTSLKTKLTTNGVSNQMVTYIGEGHGWQGANLTDTYNKSMTFIKANVK